MSPVRKLKPLEANDGSYAGAVLAAYDRMEVDAMAHEFADMWAKSIIESETLLAFAKGESWIDLDSLADCCTRERQYAEARNLLRHHPTRPNLVKIVEK